MPIDFTKMPAVKEESLPTIDFSLMNKEMPPTFMYENTVPGLAKITGDPFKELNENIRQISGVKNIRILYPHTNSDNMYNALIIGNKIDKTVRA